LTPSSHETGFVVHFPATHLLVRHLSGLEQSLGTCLQLPVVVLQLSTVQASPSSQEIAVLTHFPVVESHELVKHGGGVQVVTVLIHPLGPQEATEHLSVPWVQRYVATH
jgi:hypothetical protein